MRKFYKEILSQPKLLTILKKWRPKEYTHSCGAEGQSLHGSIDEYNMTIYKNFENNNIRNLIDDISEFISKEIKI